MDEFREENERRSVGGSARDTSVRSWPGGRLLAEVVDRHGNHVPARAHAYGALLFWVAANLVGA